MTYYLSYYNDTLADGASLTFPDDGVHRIFYIHRGTATIDGKVLPADEAVYRRGASTLTGSDGGARVFRWDLGKFAGTVPANIESMLRMTRECWSIDIAEASEWLFRLDSIVHIPPDPADCHTHPGPGIRALLSGEFIIRQTSENGGGGYPGDPWWETGTEAVISTPVGDKPVHFLRGMLLPVPFKGRPDTAHWLRAKPKQKSAWKLYVDQAIKL